MNTPVCSVCIAPASGGPLGAMQTLAHGGIEAFNVSAVKHAQCALGNLTELVNEAGCHCTPGKGLGKKTFVRIFLLVYNVASSPRAIFHG